jgi:3-deoxy-manno-octulosonate cytidylyltransferase (CMP-KDO synthetase)
MAAPTVAIIPARYGSTRFPGKPLAVLRGVPMIVRVVERASRARLIDAAIVATDDERILATVERAGHRAVMTPKDCASGGDRCFLALAKISRFGLPSPEMVVNVQGDEPLIDPTDIDVLIAATKESRAPIGTLARPISDAARIRDPNVVKVVTAQDGRALYFSRAPIPHGANEALQHLGIYAYRVEALEKVARLPRSSLERIESLEQLRALEHGIAIHVVRSVSRSANVAIDTPEDVERVLPLLDGDG